jgi:uncharacterized protein with ATP-grasp and redox domains
MEKRPEVGYLRLLKAVVEDVINHYAEYYSTALLTEYKLLYLSEEAQKLQRQGYDISRLNKIKDELSKDVYVEDLDCFFESWLFAVACAVMGWEPEAKEKEIKKIARNRVNLAEVKEEAWQEVKKILYLANRG